MNNWQNLNSDRITVLYSKYSQLSITFKNPPSVQILNTELCINNCHSEKCDTLEFRLSNKLLVVNFVKLVLEYGSLPCPLTYLSWINTNQHKLLSWLITCVFTWHCAHCGHTSAHWNMSNIFFQTSGML